MNYPYTGYGKLNEIMNEMQELWSSANLRANNLTNDDAIRATALGSAGAYAYCIMRLSELNIGKEQE